LWWKNDSEKNYDLGPSNSDFYETGRKSFATNIGGGELSGQFKSIEDMIANDIRQLE